MKHFAFLFILSLLILRTCSLNAQDDAMMKAWIAFATPGEMHKLMSSWDGNWTTDITSWMDPTSPPQKSTGTVENKTVLNGLYQMGHYTGTMMGAPFEGYSTLAYDNAKKMFVNTWIDNMGSGVVVMTGQYNPQTKTLELKGTQSDPMTGKDSALREVIKIMDDNTQFMTMYGAGMDGKETKFMEMNMK